PGSYKGADAACDLPAKKNGPVRAGIVAEYLGPFGCERRSVRRVFGRKRGHTVGGRVQLLFEEDREVRFGDIPQLHVTCHEASSANPGVRLETSFRQTTPPPKESMQAVGVVMW